MSRYEHKDFRNERIISKFLFWPKTLNGKTRWLVLAKVKQKLTSVSHIEDNGTVLTSVLDGFRFKDISWVDKEAPINQIIKHERRTKIEG